MDPDGSAPESAAHEEDDIAAGSPALPTTTVSAISSKSISFKYKYKEAAPAPPDVSCEEWNKIFTAADSRIYNRNGKAAAKSASARAAGETRLLALQMLAEKRAKASQTSPATNSPTNLVTPALTSTPTTATDAAPSKMPTSRVPTAGGNKAIKVETSTHHALYNGSGEAINSIADKVKGKSRGANKKTSAPSHAQSRKPSPESSQQSSPALQQPPSAFFGRQDPSHPQPFTFDSSSIPHDREGPDSCGKGSSLPVQSARDQFTELGQTFKIMTLDWEDSYVKEATVEVKARDATDFDPDEKPESGSLKRYAGFEPFFKSTSVSAASPTSDSPPTKDATKPSKKKLNRGKKKAATVKRKKAIAKEDKGKDKSVDPDQEEEPSEGASSNDGGEYCICRGPDDHRKMIACDLCDEWYHCSCVGVKEDDILLIDKYICEKCAVPEIHFTTWKPMCRLKGCRKPCDLTVNPPSKYCSVEHKRKFWEEAVARAPDGPEPSRGGALTKSELKALLESKKGDVKAFHALGQKPTLPTHSDEIDWKKNLTDEESGRLNQIAAEKVVLKDRSQGFKDKEKVVRMAMDRLKKATDDKIDLTGICGWDVRLAMNEEEFDIWRKSEAGVEAFKTGKLDGTFCDKKRCTRHLLWIKLNIQDARYEDAQIAKALNKLRTEEHAIEEQAKTRTASQL